MHVLRTRVVHEVRGSGRGGPRDILKDRGCREDDFTVRNEGAFVLRLDTGNSTIATSIATEQLAGRVMAASDSFAAKLDTR